MQISIELHPFCGYFCIHFYDVSQDLCLSPPNTKEAFYDWKRHTKDEEGDWWPEWRSEVEEVAKAMLPEGGQEERQEEARGGQQERQEEARGEQQEERQEEARGEQQEEREEEASGEEEEESEEEASGEEEEEAQGG